MKKLISLLLVLAMLTAITSSAVPAKAVTHGYIRGDANDDTEITMADVLAMRKYIAGIFSDRDISYKGADTNEDGDITNSDLLTVRKTVAGLLDEEGNNTDAAYHVSRIAIDEKNICRYTIVTTSDNVCMTYGAEELQKYIKEACGITLAISNDINSVDGYKIIYKFDEEDTENLGKEGYRVFVDEADNLVMLCGSMRAPLYATYYVLEELIGYRFLTQNVTYLYKCDSININADLDEKEVPLFEYRAPVQKGININNCAKLRMNAANLGGLRIYMEPKYGYGVGTVKVHAHSFEYQCGIAATEQPCMSDETTFKQVMAYNEALIKEKQALGFEPGISYTQISCSQNDNEEFCFCSYCKTVYDAEQSIAGPLLRLCNRVADATTEKYPDLDVFTIVYSRTFYPPKMTRPNENVNITYCFLGCNNHTLEDPECTGNPRFNYADYDGSKPENNNARQLEQLKGWAELTDNLWVWYYQASFGLYLAPSPNVTNVYYDFRTCAEMGVKGVYCECCTEAESNYEFLKTYLAAKVMWDPCMSEEEFYKLLDEFLMIYYGEGWENVKELLFMEEHAGDLQGCWTNNYDRTFDQYNKQYMADNYDHMLELIENTRALASGWYENSRIDNLQMHIDFICLSAQYESNYVNGTAEQKAIYKERYQDFWRRCDEWGTRFSDSYDVTPHGCTNFPKSKDEIYNPMEWYAKGYVGQWRYDGSRWV